jgi:hypothetical protein
MSDSIEKIKFGAKEILSKEGKKFAENVKQNIRSSGMSKSGATERSVHEVATEDSLIVWGRKDFQNIETGTSPQEAKRLNFTQLKANIYQWSKYLPLSFENNKKRYSFAWNVSNKIVEFGTQLYRKGGRKDIYSNEFQPLYDSLTKEIGKVILEYKLL